MNAISYPALFERDPEAPHLWNVTVPGLDGTADGAMTCGNSLEDARRMAVDLVNNWLVIHHEEGRRFPEAGILPTGIGWELVYPSLRTSSALKLRDLRKKAGMTQAQAAEALGVSQPAYARLEDPWKANPSLKTLEKVARVFGVHLELKEVCFA